MLSLEACEGSAMKKKKYIKSIHPRRKALEKGLEVGADDSQASRGERMTNGCNTNLPEYSKVWNHQYEN